MGTEEGAGGQLRQGHVLGPIPYAQEGDQGLLTQGAGGDIAGGELIHEGCEQGGGGGAFKGAEAFIEGLGAFQVGPISEFEAELEGDGPRIGDRQSGDAPG